GSSDENIDSCVIELAPVANLGHVAEVWRVRVVVRQHGGGERLDLSEPRSLPSQRPPCDGRGLDSAAHAAVSQRPLPFLYAALAASLSASADSLPWRFSHRSRNAGALLPCLATQRARHSIR